MLEFEYQLAASVAMSTFAYKTTQSLIPRFIESFTKAHLVGVDVNKKNRPVIPEAMGVVAGCVFLMSMYLYLPIPYLDSWGITRHIFSLEKSHELFDHKQFAAMLAALLSICCMIFLGFADDVLDLRWRHKLLLPTLACIPLLIVYMVQYNVTTVVVPKQLRLYMGRLIEIGPFYYIYMGMLAIFCTNSINILAGINGLEVGQSLIIAASILVFNCMEITGDCWQAHLFSLTFILPFLAVSYALYQLNAYPAQVFVGDTYCYFAGMTFAVVGILGHFSKTMLLFFIPQIFNFIFSTPQLFHIIDCPRHRMPKYIASEDTLIASTFNFDPSQANILARLIISIYSRLGLVRVTAVSAENSAKSTCDEGHSASISGNIVPPAHSTSTTAMISPSTASHLHSPGSRKHDKEDEHAPPFTVTNCTLVNLMIIKLNPMHERNLTRCVLVLQLLCSLIAFFIRYGISKFIY